MRIKNQIPNALTCCNLLSGCLSVVSSFDGNLEIAFYWVLAGLVFDFADGFSARLLSASSPIGKELDSLADCITFGLAPACFLIPFLKTSAYIDQFSAITYAPFLITIFSAVRLARFNIDTRQTDSFIGLPTPANAIFSFSIPTLFEKAAYFVTLDPIFSLLIILLQSYLMNAAIPLIALKFKNYTWADNKNRYFIMAVSIVAVLILGIQLSIPVIILVYVLVSVVANSLQKR